MTKKRKVKVTSLFNQGKGNCQKPRNAFMAKERYKSVIFVQLVVSRSDFDLEFKVKIKPAIL